MTNGQRDFKRDGKKRKCTWCNKNAVNVIFWKHIVINLLQTTPKHFKQSISLFLPLSEGLSCTSRLPWCPKLIQKFDLAWSFCLERRVRSHVVSDPVNKADEDTPKCFSLTEFAIPEVHTEWHSVDMMEDGTSLPILQAIFCALHFFNALIVFRIHHRIPWYKLN